MPRRMTLSETPELPSASLVMMNLRRLVSEKSPKPWHEVMRLEPLGAGADASFRVYVLSPSGSDWLGDYTPQDASNLLSGLADEILSMHESKVAGPKPTGHVLDADGEVVANEEIVGQVREVKTARGVIPVTVRRAIPVESATQEERRLREEIERFPVVEMDFDQPQSLTWNGLTRVFPAGLNPVPAPYADIYRQAKQSDRQARQRMSVALDLGASETYIMNERRG